MPETAQTDSLAEAARSGSYQLCTLHLDGHLLGVPVTRVREAISYLSLTRVPLAHGVVQGLINLRGEIVMAIDLRRRLGFADRADGAGPMNIVVQTPLGVVSLQADAVGDVVDVDDTRFELPPDTLAGEARTLITGVYKFDDSLLLELDIDRVVDLPAAAVAAVA